MVAEESRCCSRQTVGWRAGGRAGAFQSLLINQPSCALLSSSLLGELFDMAFIQHNLVFRTSS